MEVFSRNRNRPKQVVYVQLRQMVRDKEGRLQATKTEMITVHDATIEQVRKLIEENSRDME